MSEKIKKILMYVPIWGAVALLLSAFVRVIKGELENSRIVKLIPIIFFQILPVHAVLVFVGLVLDSFGIDILQLWFIFIITTIVGYWSNYVVYKTLKKHGII